MKTVVVKGEKREALGKKESKLLRSQGVVPAVLYGMDEPIHFSVPFSALRKLVYTPNIYLIDLEIDGTVYPSIMQDIQWHPVDETIFHVDFLKINDDKKVKIDVPVTIKGLAEGIKAGGKLKSNLRRLKVKAFAKDLPDSIEIDVTKLKIGMNIKVGDLTRDNLEFLDEKSNVIVAVQVTRVAKSTVDLGEDDEEGEEGEGEEAAESSAGE